MSNDHKGFSVKYLPLLIKLTCLESAQLPDFLGSTLRGAMGWILLPNKALYKYLFENRRLGGGNQDIVNPYVIVPPLYHHGRYEVGDELVFQMVLIGNATGFAMSLIHTLVEKRNLPLGVKRKQFEISQILHGDSLSPIWQSEQLNGLAVKTKVISSHDAEGKAHCSIQLLTPLRIRRNGQLLKQIDFPVIIRNMSRRMIELTERYGGSVDQNYMQELCEGTSGVQTLCSSLVVREVQRYSSRKQEKMDFDGIMGVLMFEGNLDPFVSLLRAARILHMGRNVTMGFGQVEVVIW